MPEAVPGTPQATWPQVVQTGAERERTHLNAANPHSHPQRGLATDRESNVYLACGLLFAMGVLLALFGAPVGAVRSHEIGGQCHGQR